MVSDNVITWFVAIFANYLFLIYQVEFIERQKVISTIGWVLMFILGLMALTLDTETGVIGVALGFILMIVSSIKFLEEVNG